MQNQNSIENLTFNWGVLAGKSIFLPRVTYRKLILHLATWNLPRHEWETLLNKNEQDLHSLVETFRKKWRMPRYCVLADGDNGLFIDFENTLILKTFLHTIKSRKEISLKEFIFDPETPIRNRIGNKFVNQFIASFIRTETNSKFYQTPIVSKKVKRTFIPGSEWLYYKYYCGTKIADAILIKVIKPLAQRLLKSKLIDSWFFIRYKDPHNHLRVRFRLKDPKRAGEALEIHRISLEKHTKPGEIWKIQIDTYEREIERYGSTSIELSEELFFHDSIAVTSFLSIRSSSYPEELRWLWGMKAIDELMNDFKLDLQNKTQVIDFLKTTFANEFKLEKSSKLQIDKKYRKYRSEIEAILNPTTEYKYQNLIKIIYQRSIKIAAIAEGLIAMEKKQSLTIPLNDLVQSYVHVLLNRLIPTAQRFHEMIIYDFLHKYYSSQKARKINPT